MESLIWKSFVSTALSLPNKIAIKTETINTTYQQLYEEAKRVSRLLFTIGRQHIALLFHQGDQMIVAMLAALKLNFTYIPIDPNLPIDRIKSILINSNAGILITDKFNKSIADSLKLNIFILEYPNMNMCQTINHEIALKNEFQPAINDCAYIIYTSGSTGQPKGVMQTQFNVVNHIKNYIKALQITSSDNLSLFASYAFDAAVMDIYAAILSGATLCPFDVKKNHIEKVTSFIQANHITVLHMAPTLFRHFGNIIEESNKFKLRGLRYVVLGGELVTKNDILLFNEKFSENTYLVNGYGPTECSVAFQYHIKCGTNCKHEKIPIGKPLSGISYFLHNKNHLNIGEIAIKSQLVAHGYWDNAELTAKQFSYCDKDYVRIYYTGDYGFVDQDGNLVLIGRKDDQVKIRGYRVELAEIENALLGYNGIKHGVALLKKFKNEQNLIAYYISNIKLDEKDILNHLKKKLPEYMLPRLLIFLDKLPLLANGKVDKKALPEPQFANNYLAPRNILEKKMRKIWADLFGCPENHIGIRDDLFSLGGDSVLALRLASKINKEFSSQFDQILIFKYNTIEKLTEYLKSYVVNNKTYEVDDVWNF